MKARLARSLALIVMVGTISCGFLRPALGAGITVSMQLFPDCPGMAVNSTWTPTTGQDHLINTISTRRESHSGIVATLSSSQDSLQQGGFTLIASSRMHTFTALSQIFDASNNVLLSGTTSVDLPCEFATPDTGIDVVLQLFPDCPNFGVTSNWAPVAGQDHLINTVIQGGKQQAGTVASLSGSQSSLGQGGFSVVASAHMHRFSVVSRIFDASDNLLRSGKAVARFPCELSV